MLPFELVDIMNVMGRSLPFIDTPLSRGGAYDFEDPGRKGGQAAVQLTLMLPYDAANCFWEFGGCRKARYFWGPRFSPFLLAMSCVISLLFLLLGVLGCFG